MSAASLWNQLIMAQRMAQVARDTMRSKADAQVFRDEATQVLVIQTNRIMDVLEKMSEQQLLTQIGALLSVRGQ